MSEYKLGLLPADPNMPALRFADLVTGVIPAVPKAVDFMTGFSYGLYANDKFGVCGPCSVANLRRGVTQKLQGKMVAPTQEDVYDLYRRSGNPRFNPSTGEDDNGVNMQKMFGAVAKGGIAGQKCMAYAKVDPKNLSELKAAIAIFGAVDFGVDLQKAQQNQTDQGFWEYVPGSPSWGGHAIIASSYDDDQIDVFTWGKRVRMTHRYVQACASEAWVVIWPEHFVSEGFTSGIDFAKLASGYEALTNRKFPSWDLPQKDTFVTVG